MNHEMKRIYKISRTFISLSVGYMLTSGITHHLPEVWIPSIILFIAALFADIYSDYKPPYS